MDIGGNYQDWMSKIDYTLQTFFTYEPEGDIYPYYEKKNQEAWSLPSWNDNDEYLGSSRSTFTDGFDPNAGDWEMSGKGMNDTDYSQLKAFSETNPPNHYFLLHKDRLNITYLVEIAKFRGNWNKEFMWWEYTIKLLNKGVVV